MQLAIILSILSLAAPANAVPLADEIARIGRQCETISAAQCAKLVQDLADAHGGAVGNQEKTTAGGGGAMSSGGLGPAIIWLLANQNASGSWGAPWFSEFRPTTELRDTATVAEAFVGGGAAQALAMTYLNGRTPGSIDALARITRTRALAGENVTTAANTLISARTQTGSLPVTAPNYPNSGWGSHLVSASGGKGEANALDTALSLHAIAAAGIAITSAGAQYLLACQNLDGGFGYQPLRDSSLFVTSHAVLALSEYPSVPNVPAAVQAAADYIITFQDPGGAIGESPGAATAHETALGALALEAAGRTPEAALAESALLGQQETNGSWDDDPYATGLAVILLPEPGSTAQLLCGAGLLAALVRWRCAAGPVPPMV